MYKLPVRKIKIVIAEDNNDFREILQLFFEPLDQFEVIGVANDGLELLDLNFTLKPDLILVDIQMPMLNGTDAYKECVKTNSKVKCIFITAYDDFAIEAFELNVLDYIVKPIDKKRLYVALERAREGIEAENQLNNPSQLKRLVVKFDGSLYVISLNSIIYIEKVNRKTYVHTKEQIFETYETLETIKESLDEHFFASHRSYIINLKHVSQIKNDGETYFAYFRNYLKFAYVSKLKLQILQNKLKNLI
ncbi:LytTR family DNA-binding domain-containing protein [Bacillaceae bacterium IKA-2]|jgi:two-component system LytT family response regulator|nr:LytTR family DNA-binding domain-containing protein [Bacillaceae bacterium IKA-2]